MSLTEAPLTFSMVRVCALSLGFRFWGSWFVFRADDFALRVLGLSLGFHRGDEECSCVGDDTNA